MKPIWPAFALSTAFALLALIARADAIFAPPRVDGDPLRLGFVFGLDLTIKEAASAVSLPDGRLLGLATVSGSESYIQLMTDWYNICTAKDATLQERLELANERYPPVSAEQVRMIGDSWRAAEKASQASWSMSDWLHYIFPWKEPDQTGRSLQTFLGDDRAVEIITGVLSELRDKTLAKLKNITDLHIQDRPYTEVSLPDWLFTTKSYLIDDEQQPPLTSSRDYRQLAWRASIAAHKAGFRGSVEDDLLEVMYRHYKGSHYLGPRLQSSMAIRSALHGTCEVIPTEGQGCTLKPVDRSPRRLAAVIDQRYVHDAMLLTLWLQAHPDLVPGLVRLRSWNMSLAVSDDAVHQKDLLLATAAEIRDAINHSSASNWFNTDERPSLLLTGDHWLDKSLLSDFLEDPLLQDVEFDVVRGEGDPYLAAISTAEVARYEWFMHNVHHLQDVDFPRIFRENQEKSQREL